MMPRRNTEADFWARTERRGACLVWTGKPDRDGYGRVKAGGKWWKVHRLAWELRRGPIPKGMLVCHTCDQPACIEILHLFLGTDATNAIDRDAKGRGVSLFGISNGMASHPYSTVVEARRLRAEGLSAHTIAIRLGVNEGTLGEWLGGRRRVSA